MTTNLRSQVIRNIGSNWLGLGVTIAVGFFLSPFVLHKLGDDAFGLWILIFSVTGYYGLFDFGMRQSIVKQVAEYAATGDHDRLLRVVNTGIFSYGCLSLLLLLVTGVGCCYLDSIFRVEPAFSRTARLLMLIVGSGIALSSPLSVFSGVLQGLQQYHWMNLVQIVSNLVRAALVVLSLNRGFGLLTLALITVAIPILGSAGCMAVARRLIRYRLDFRLVDRAAFRRLSGYGAVIFVAIAADRLRFGSDATVIGIFLSASAITYFSIGSKLVDYASSVVDSMADTFMPLSSHLEATCDLPRLRRLFIAGNRACAMEIFPLCATLLILGKSLIDIWVGRRYASAYLILVLLVVPRTAYRSQGASTRILFGTARHRLLSMVLLAEGTGNLLLSVALIRPLGIVGVAIGTAIPMLGTSLFFLPQYLCKLLGVRLRDFLSQAYGWPAMLNIPLVAVLLLMRHWFHTHNYTQLLLQLLAAGFVYGAGVFWVFYSQQESVFANTGSRLKALAGSTRAAR